MLTLAAAGDNIVSKNGRNRGERMKRIFLIVADSMGVGAAPDAHL